MKTVDQAAPAADTAAPAAPPTWRVVLTLALPVLAPQLLVFAVARSDQFLAGHFQAVTPREQAEATGHRLLAVGLLHGGPAGAALPATVSAAAVHLEAARHILARQVSYQAAQTTANYLAWFISSYTVLVSVGSTALVARFTGAGDRAAAVHVTNQSLLLGVALGLAGGAAGLLGLRGLVAMLQL